MQQLRVVDLAHTMGITSTELIFKLRSIGVTVTSEEDTLDLSTVRAIITGETLQRRPREVIVRREPKEEETTPISAKDRLAKRRRRQVVDTDKEIQEVLPEKPLEAEPDETAAEADLETVETAEVVETAETVETDVEIAAEAPVEEEETVETEPVVETSSEAEPEAVGEVAEAADEEEGVEVKPEVEITEEELTAQRTDEEEEKRRNGSVRAARRRRSSRACASCLPTRSASAWPIRKRPRSSARPIAADSKIAGRKAKAAADAKEIRDLLNKFEEQKLKGQQEGGAPSRPTPRPTGGRPTKKGADVVRDERPP